MREIAELLAPAIERACASPKRTTAAITLDVATLARVHALYRGAATREQQIPAAAPAPAVSASCLV
jgi:hypothetical protein